MSIILLIVTNVKGGVNSDEWTRVWNFKNNTDVAIVNESDNGFEVVECDLAQCTSLNHNNPKAIIMKGGSNNLGKLNDFFDALGKNNTIHMLIHPGENRISEANDEIFGKINSLKMPIMNRITYSINSSDDSSKKVLAFARSVVLRLLSAKEEIKNHYGELVAMFSVEKKDSDENRVSLSKIEKKSLMPLFVLCQGFLGVHGSLGKEYARIDSSDVVRQIEYWRPVFENPSKEMIQCLYNLLKSELA